MPTGLFVTHPLTGEKVEVWVGNYVLMSYGDGAVMGVPAHDERDFAFAKKYGLPINAGRSRASTGDDVLDRRVAAVVRGQGARALRALRQVRRPRATRQRSMRSPPTSPRRDWARRRSTFRLRDWGISRQRYWGTPIPIVHCAACGDVPVPEQRPARRAAGGLRPRRHRQPAREARATSSTRRVRAAAGRRSARPTRWTRSSTRRGTTCATRAPTRRRWSIARNDYWNPMDQYIGGIEHAILHLLYARFWTKVMRDLGLVAVRRAVHAAADAGDGAQPHLLPPHARRAASTTSRADDVDVRQDDAEGRIDRRHLKADGQPVEYGGVGTMSKSQVERRGPAGRDRPVRRRHRAPVRDVRGAAGRHARCGPTRGSRARTASCADCGRSRRPAAGAVRSGAARVGLQRCRRAA